MRACKAERSFNIRVKGLTLVYRSGRYVDGQKGNSNSHSISSKVSNPKTTDKPSVNLVSSLQAITILVTIGDKKTRCLVDTGATISCASLTYLKKTGINCTHFKPANIKNITGIGSETHAVLGKLENIITISGITISFEFLIFQKLIHPVILGTDFLKFHKVHSR